MGIKQTPPGGGGGQRREHFTYVGTPHGKQWHAYIAGPAQWYTCHTKGKSKPCLLVTTEGELLCPRCGEPTPAEVIAYVPLYRELDSKPVLVITHEYTREVVDALKLHQRVIVGRGADSSDGCYVIPAPSQNPKFVTSRADRKIPADITEVLLRLWGYSDLMQWHCLTTGVSMRACITRSVPPADSPVAQPPADLPKGVVPVGETADEAYAAVKGRLSKFSTNGNGKHGPK